jgi:hypothetical protein
MKDALPLRLRVSARVILRHPTAWRRLRPTATGFTADPENILSILSSCPKEHPLLSLAEMGQARLAEVSLSRLPLHRIEPDGPTAGFHEHTASNRSESEVGLQRASLHGDA